MSDLQRLVAACHKHGLAVILDVVYNHLGPEGNYLHEFGPYFTERHTTPWGAAVNFDDTSCEGMRSMVLDNVRFYDVRILTIDSAEPERFLTSEKKNVLVDLFVKWRITDVRSYFTSVGGDEGRAQTRLLQTINDGLRAEFGNRTVHDVVSGERDEIMDLMRKKANEDASKIGVEVLDGGGEGCS